MQINVISVQTGPCPKWEAIMVGFGRHAVKYLEYLQHPLPDLLFGFLQIESIFNWNWKSALTKTFTKLRDLGGTLT